MMRLIIRVILGFLYFVSLHSHAELKVLTLNSEWLWTPYDGKVDGKKFNKGDMHPAQYQNELEFYSSLIMQYQIDIVAISEIENRQVADELAAKLGMGWKAYFRQGRDTATGQDVALLSKLPVVKGSVTDFGFPYGRIQGSNKKKRLSKIVGAMFWVADGTTKSKVGVVTSHFLSKRNNSFKKNQNRNRQAFALTKAISAFSDDTDKIVVLGDLNDDINSSTLKIVLGGGKLQSVGKCNIQTKKNRKFRRQIDHILYQGLECKDAGVLNLENFSDHDAIFGVFK